MRRTPLLVLLCLAVCAAPAAGQERVPLRASLAGCTSGPKGKDRVAVFTASMPAMAGTNRMRMRFDLYERRSSKRRWRRINAPGFTGWVHSKSRGASGFVYTKRIERLRQGRVYRAVVRFRWYDATGRLQRSAMRRTPVCEQPDQRADLRVDGLEVVPVAGGMARYLITVVNDGLTAADDFTVGLSTPGGDDARDVAALAPGDRTTVEIRAEACSSTDRVQATVDVKGTVAEADERDNTYLTFCPSGRSGSAPERR
jgi:hypothetical protein